MPTTLADIARELGVSKMTVSRAINNHPEISAETRKRVLEAARRLKYRPNQHARALITNRSNLLGMVVPDLMHSYFAEILSGVESVAREAGLQIVICNTYENAAYEIAEVEALRLRTDGLIVASALPPGRAQPYRKMIRDGLKLVLVDRRLERLRCPVVTTDNVVVGEMATGHLIDLGYRRIGHLRGAAASVADDRFEGYKRALARRGLKFNPALVRDCGFIEDDGYRTMRSWIAEGDLPEAVFAANDPAAIGAIHALNEAGLRVGPDLAVVGAGNVHYGDMLAVPLTTVAWSTAEIGQRAAELLIASIDGSSTPISPEYIVVPPRLLLRRSSLAASR
ncbi:MAG: LacI family DNA-binding transcriptional regulator [Acidobacteria bacterium]|nr:LacI family DNA-binding transcriptional regulator [Acidobacteriota bacterium]MCW5971362.1 LacI family DNA-binding transcriptional regulator [Blastocatellales bacterium]